MIDMTNSFIAGLLFSMVNAVVFGAGTVAILSVPALRAHDVWLLPAWIATTFMISPVISWYMAPRLRSRRWHVRQALMMRHHH